MLRDRCASGFSGGSDQKLGQRLTDSHLTFLPRGATERDNALNNFSGFTKGRVLPFRMRFRPVGHVDT